MKAYIITARTKFKRKKDPNMTKVTQNTTAIQPVPPLAKLYKYIVQESNVII